MSAAATATVLLNRLMARARMKHLQVLVKVAELGSLSKAGEAIGMTQPAVTHVVSDLESLLGVALFKRHARGVSTTPFCDDLLPAALQVIELMGQSAERVVARLEDASGNVKVGATAAAVAGFMAEAIVAFNEAHADVAVQLTEARPGELVLMAGRGEFDLVACRKPAVLPEGWAFVPIVADRLVVACGAGHPLVSRRRVGFAQLRRETWLAAPVSTVGRRTLDELFAREETAPRFARVSTIAVAATCALLKRRRLLTLIPYGVIRPFVEAGELAVLSMDESIELEPLGLLVPSVPRNAAARSLAEFLVARGG